MFRPGGTCVQALLVLLVLSAVGRAVSTGSQNGAQRFRAEAVGVLVDAVVRDSHGHPLRCLSKSDFSITEDGIQQQIEGFESVGAQDCGNTPPNSSEVRPVALPATLPPAVTAIVFEELGPDARAAAFRAAQAFVRERRLESEFVGVFTLDFAIHTIVPYTRDQAALLDAVRRAAMRPGCPEAVAGLITNADGGSTCGGGSISEAKVKATLFGLQAVVRTLAALPGRKNILLFSEGFRISTAESAVDRFEGMIEAANQRGVTFHTIDVVGLRTIDGRQATRQRLSTYTAGEIGAGGLATTKEDANALLALDPTAALARLAVATGGQFVSSTNDIDGAVRQLAGEMHDYYQLSYQPTKQSSDARYRRVAVKVSVPGAVVSTRSGYYAGGDRGRDVHVLSFADVAPHLTLDAGTTPRDFEMSTSLDRTGRDVEVRASVPAAGLTFVTTDGRFQAGVTILARAVGPDQNVLAAASDTLALSGPSEGLPGARARTLRFTKTLALKGARTVEVVAYDIVGRRASVERFDLSSRLK
jgi:VWFA-related protein